jgi:UDP-N-acetylmuramate dehydrogenase
VPVTVVGVGSNLIVRDGGVPGVVIRLTPKGFGATTQRGDEIEAGTAVLDKRLATAAAEAGLAGLEFLVGIPGSVGGALRMNAGAHGRETKDTLISARAVTRRGEKIVIDKAAMGFSYRKSTAPADCIFTAGTFRGTPDAKDAITARMAEVTTHREAAQPIREKTGGSTFKNPPGTGAWKVIDAAGCRGLIVGDAQVSEMHCNFLINRGGATAAEIETLGETVRTRVREHSGIELEWEIKRIGEAG